MPPETEVGQRAYGGFAVGDLCVAVPMEELIEAAHVEVFLDLAADSEWVVGGIRLREHVIPVVDLERALGRARRERFEYVVVVSHGDAVVGIGCDRVRDFFEAENESEAAEGSLVAGYVTAEGVEGAFAVLDVEKLVGALPSAIRAAGGLRSTASSRGRARARARRCVLLRAGSRAFAIPTTVVQSVVGFDEIAPAPYAGGTCVGSIDRGEHKMPAVDLARLVEGGDRPRCGPGHAIVVRYGAGHVALAGDQVLDIAPVSDEITRRVQRPPGRAEWLVEAAFESSQLDGFGLAAAVHDHDYYLILDEEQLRSHTVLERLASLEMGRHEADSARAAHANRAATSYVTFSAGVVGATPLTQVVEIVALPPAADEAAILMSHGHAVTVLALEELVGLPVAPGGQRHVLVVDGAMGRVGFSIATLEGIEVALEERELPVTAFTSPIVAEACDQRSVVVDGAQRERVLPRFDLLALAERRFEVDRGARDAPLAA